MSWETKTPSSFGSVDKIFADHPGDCTRADEMFYKANKENIGQSEYFKKIEMWLLSQGCIAQYIKKQMERVKDINNYFNYD